MDFEMEVRNETIHNRYIWRHLTIVLTTLIFTFGLAPDSLAFKNNLHFSGHYYDEESGLYYNWNRYYNPRTGRYMTSDPIGLQGGINKYGYAAANPLTKTDHSGLFWLTVHLAVTQSSALGAGMDSSSALELSRLTADVDSLPGSQDSKNSHWHAMRHPDWNVNMAKAKFERVVLYSAYSPALLGTNMLKLSFPPDNKIQTKAL